MVYYNNDWHVVQIPPPARPKRVPGDKGVKDVVSRADTELSAMQEIANALSTLPDGEARTRVLRWAAEHFDANVTPSVVQAQQVQPTAALQALEGEADPLNLDTIFDDGIAPTFHAQTPLRHAKPPVVTALHNFVADFQKLARDWQSA
jgi:hypothetical protein